MKKASPLQRHATLACLVTVLLGIPLAQADYTVINDDLYPDTIIQARQKAAMAPVVPEHHTIPFANRKSPLTSAGIEILANLLPRMQGTSIRIACRLSDLSKGTIGIVARRTARIREHLASKGIPANRIAINTDKIVIDQPKGTTPVCDIYIAPTNDTFAQTYTPQQQQQQQQPQQNAANNNLMQYINQAVASGQLSPEVALQLIQAMLTSNNSQADPRVVTARKEIWMLNKTMTLRENIESWSKKAGWKSVVWEAANYYQVTTTSSIDGTFPEILRKIAEGTGLNICANTREKQVRVTDANYSCK